MLNKNRPPQKTIQRYSRCWTSFSIIFCKRF